MTFGSDRIRTARQAHRCYLCWEQIEIGTRYHSRAGVQDDDFWFMKMHPECQEASRNWKGDDWECFEEGTLKRPVSQ